MSDNFSNNDNYSNLPDDPGFAGGYTPQFPEEPPKKGKAIASMVLGIVSLVVCCLPFITVPAAIAGLVVGIISLKKREGGKGMAIAGIIMSGIGIILGCLMFVYYGLVGVSLSDPSFLQELERITEEANRQAYGQ